MNRFIQPRDRDAWGIIRGYVYQVDLTVERWLDLLVDQVLELERGEDIDLVAQSICATDIERDRLLEQVKLRDQPLTLRTPAALEALANAVAHRQANPNLTLVFRYTTNAGVGRERATGLPRRIPAITLWEQLRTGVYPSALIHEALTSIRALLQNVRQPSNLPDDTWQMFLTFVGNSNDDALLTFIKTFEWSTANIDAASMRRHIPAMLIQEGYATDDDDAQDLYQRLFFFIFKLLSQPGIKRLTRQQLTEQLSRPRLNDTDRTLLRVVTGTLDTLEQRVQTLEQESERYALSLAHIERKMESLARSQEHDVAVAYRVATPILDIPPLDGLLSSRREVVQQLRAAIEHATWVALYGGIGSGKTVLANLTARELGTCRMWIRFRDLSISQACQRFDAACQTLTASPPHLGVRWYEQLCDRLSAPALIVLDDLPRLTGNDELSDRLVVLVAACRMRDVRLLSTSPHPLPPAMSMRFDQQALEVIATPLFTEYDVAEVLRAHGATEEFLTSETVRSVHRLAHHHPVLVAGIACYLQQSDWCFDDAVFERLLQQSYATDINDSTVQALLQQVTDAQSRELLYRLTLPIGSVSFDDVFDLATVEPIVDRPRERLHLLSGLWVQRDTTERLTVSPLIKVLGSRDLLHTTQRNCYTMLGNRIVQRRTLSFVDAANAIIYFLNAEQAERAGELLIRALDFIRGAETRVDDAGLLTYWANLPLPSTMSLGTRIYLRAQQIAVRRQRGMQTAYLLDDAGALIREATGHEAWAVIGLLTINPRLEPDIWLTHFATMLHLLPDAQLPNGQPMSPEIVTQLGSLIWFCVETLTTEDQLRQWMDVVALFTPEQRHRAFTDTPAEEGCMRVANRIWLLEAEKPAEHQQWASIDVALRDLADRAWGLQLPLLWGCAVRTRLMVLADHCRDLAGAVAVAEAVLEQVIDDVRIAFLVQECIGRQFVFAGHLAEAERWLTKAITQPTDVFPGVQVQALLHLSHVIGKHNSQGAISYAQQAVSRAETSIEIPVLTTVRAQCELALAYWLAGDLRAAFDMWDRAGERLLAKRTDTDDWKELFVIYGHASGYLAQLAATGEPPAALRSGEPYAAPERGMFLTYNSGRIRYYDRSRDSFIMAQLAMFAEAVGRDDRTAAWAIQGVDLARADQQWLVFAELSEDMLPHLLLDDRYADVLDVALDIGPLNEALQERRRRGEDPLYSKLDVEELLGPKSTRHWLMADYRSAMVGLVPIIFRLSTIALDQVERARTAAQELAGLCRQISATRFHRHLWETAAMLLETSAIEVPGYDSLITHSKELQGEYDNVLQLIGYLGATWQPDATPERILSIHLGIMPQVYRLFSPPSTTYRRIMLQYIDQYWRRAVERARFRFRTPSLVETELRRHEALSDRERAQAILRTVIYGLGMHVPEDLQHWLRQSGSGL